MGKNISARNLGAVTPADFEKLRSLRRMQAVALWLLVAMAVIFAVAFSLQDSVPAFGFVRAASEGGMVGAIADWFAVTALFRRPLGLKIPHTNLIAQKKDDIGEGLGTFIEDNFLADDVVHDKLSTISGARHAGEWLSNTDNAKRVSDVATEVLLAALTVLDDKDVQDLFEEIVKKHVLEPSWSPVLAKSLETLLRGEHEATIVDIVADHLQSWLVKNPRSFDKLVTGRLPAWLPDVALRFVDKKAHAQVLKFLESVQNREDHPLRLAVSKMLQDLKTRLARDQELQARVEELKMQIFTSPRVREIAGASWAAARVALQEMLSDEGSQLRGRITGALRDLGVRLADDATLQYKVDVWVMNAVEHLVHNYRHDLASIISDTVKEWDATEAAEKIELQIGKDLQFIRINGTVVGSLAGLLIYTVATLARAAVI